ncbi:low molecular weight protein-tyrosine-phosphatase [Aquabacterium sp.]|uniref:low molecular weight protein-tyrosine-phosphatase n=1 Tax=Aquabacterium sp. TaxID=1872578 RepID=UPI003BB1865B
MYRILLVCLGNICRSPLAEAVFHDVMARRGLASMLKVDSAAIGRSHLKEKPDRRAIACALSRGYRHIEQIRSRPVKAQDFLQFDLILAMDESVLRALQRQCPQDAQHKLDLFLRFAGHEGEAEVPDPYYGNAEGFTKVLDLCESGVTAMVQKLNLPD